MTAGFMIKLIAEVLIFTLITVGFIKEKKLMAFEDKIIRTLSAEFQRRKRARSEAYRKVAAASEKSSVNMPDNAA